MQVFVWHRIRRDAGVTAEHGHRGPARLVVVAACLLLLAATPARGEPFGWPQPGGPGTPVVISYSFSNLFDPIFQGIPELELRTATTEAFGLWSLHSPLHFVEQPDSGPSPSDDDYFAGDHPDIRIGAHAIDNAWILAHAFLASQTETSGLAGDIHFNRDSMLDWGIGDGFPAIDFLEVMAHEIGHALGLQHVLQVEAIMNPYHAFRFAGGGTPFLLPADIAAVQSIYGAGVGSVQPIPEPSTLMLVAGGVIAAVRRARRPRRDQLSPS